MKKFLSLLLVIVFLFTVGCKEQSTGKDTTASNSQTETENKSVCEQAIDLIGKKEYLKAYELLMSNKDDPGAAIMLESFYWTYDKLVLTEKNDEDQLVTYVEENKFNSYGNLISTTNDSKYTEYFYDANGTKVYTTIQCDVKNVSPTFEYDENGEKFKQIGSAKAYVGDDNLLLKVLWPNDYIDPVTGIPWPIQDSFFNYDNSGRILTREDKYRNGRARTVSYVYSENQKIVEDKIVNKDEITIDKYVSTYNEKGELIKYEYYSNGNASKIYSLDKVYDDDYNIIKFTDESNTTEYDKDGNIIKEIVDSTIKTTKIYEYDKNGNRIKETVKYEYDPDFYLNKAADTIVTEFVYDKNGNCIKMTVNNTAGSLSEYLYEYDEENNKVSEKRIVDGVLESESSFEYTYDDDKNVKTKKTYADGNVSTIEYQYDGKGRVVSRKEFSDTTYTIITTNTYSGDFLEKQVVSSSYYTETTVYDKHGNELLYERTTVDGRLENRRETTGYRLCYEAPEIF